MFWGLVSIWAPLVASAESVGLAPDGHACVASSFDYFDIQNLTSYQTTELNGLVRSLCNQRCGENQQLRWDLAVPTLRVSHRHRRPIARANESDLKLLFAPEVPSTLSAQWQCELEKLSGFACRQLRDLAIANWPPTWCRNDVDENSATHGQGAALSPDDSNASLATLCEMTLEATHDEQSCNGVSVRLVHPRDGASYHYQPHTKIEVKLEIVRSNGSTEDLRTALDRLPNASVAVSTDLVTWSIYVHPSDRGYPIGYIYGTVGDHSVYAQVLDGAGRPLCRLIKSTFMVTFDASSETGRALDLAFAPAPDMSTDEVWSTRHWYEMRPWQLPARARVFRSNGHIGVAEATEHAYKGLQVLPERSPLVPPTPFAERRPGVAPNSRYISFRSPPNGLSPLPVSSRRRSRL